MSKIGIFGGTFNPPHSGHLHLARLVKEKLGVEKIIIIPANVPPHKIPGSLTDGNYRLEMCRRTFTDDYFEFSTAELDRGDKSYTIDTLNFLKEKYPEDEFYLIIGSDMLESFTRWYRWADILSIAVIVSASRETDFKADLSVYTDEQRKRIIFLEADPVVISSSELRATVRSGKDTEKFLTQGVKNFIESNRLYDDGLSEYRKLLRELLDDYRLFHSECVCESAGILAEKYGADIQKARLAGLLHDITKQFGEQEHRRLIGEMSIVENSNHKVWHQMSAPAYLKEKGIVTDEEILSAIRWHTTGKSGMGLLEKIVYTADFISADRKYPDVEYVRKLANISLEKAMLYTSRYTIQTLAEKNITIHPATLDCYNDMVLTLGKA